MFEKMTRYCEPYRKAKVKKVLKGLSDQELKDFQPTEVDIFNTGFSREELVLTALKILARRRSLPGPSLFMVPLPEHFRLIMSELRAYFHENSTEVLVRAILHLRMQKNNEILQEKYARYKNMVYIETEERENNP